MGTLRARLTREGRFAAAFLKRELLGAGPWSYGLESLGGLVGLFLLHFLARCFRGTVGSFSQGMDYFTFSLIGLVLAQSMLRGFSTFSERVKFLLLSGTLETFWTTRRSLPVLLLYDSLWNLVFSSFNAALLLIFGAGMLGAHLAAPQIAAVWGISLLTSLAMGSLGLLSAATLIALGHRVARLWAPVGPAVTLTSGSFFTASVFPHWVHGVIGWFPLTHALKLARGVVLPLEPGVSAQAWGALVGLGVLQGALGWAALRWAVRRARSDGRWAAVGF